VLKKFPDDISGNIRKINFLMKFPEISSGNFFSRISWLNCLKYHQEISFHEFPDEISRNIIRNFFSRISSWNCLKYRQEISFHEFPDEIAWNIIRKFLSTNFLIKFPEISSANFFSRISWWYFRKFVLKKFPDDNFRRIETCHNVQQQTNVNTTITFVCLSRICYVSGCAVIRTAHAVSTTCDVSI
jgi:hypothetical protein